MNKTFLNSFIGVLVAAAIIGGIYYATTKKATAPEPTPTGESPSQVPGQVSGKPSVKTKSANYISQSTAVLDAEINPNGAQTSYWYEYGTTQSLGSITIPQLLGAGYVNYSAPGFVSGLSADTKYYFRAVAENRNGRVNGSISSFTTTNKPPVPGNPPVADTTSASDVDHDSATLNGRLTTQNSKTYYWFEYGTTSALGDTTSSSVQDPGSATVSVSKTIRELKEGTRYYYRLNAQNGYGTDNGPIRSFVTQAATPTPPVPPAGEEPTADTDPATSITADGATLNGKINPNGAQTTYWFEYGRATLLGVFDLTEKTSEKSVGAGKATVSVTQAVSGLQADATYYYRLVGKSQYGTNYGSIHKFTTDEK